VTSYSMDNTCWPHVIYMVISVIAQGCGQTLGLGLGQSKDIVVVFY